MEVSWPLDLKKHRLTLISGGKSAVLSAIAVVLGGKANSTGRGSGLKSFIREGQSYVHYCLMKCIMTSF